jgi:hypothetical protein
MNESARRVPLYDRLPAIYRIRDAEQTPPHQLRAFLASVEDAFGAIHENIEALYDDFFIDTCDDWVIPYLADLVGASHLKGDPRTLRADVADTIALRRRKGTLSALERLAANLTGWACRAVELFPNLAWTQHLNHQRPDAGGRPPYGAAGITRFTVPRGGTAPIRDPAMLQLIGTPFDPYACTADVKRADDGAVHVNVPNLAIFLWRLAAYRLPAVVPLPKGTGNLGVPPADDPGRARYTVRYDLDPLDRPVRLFNTYRAPARSANAAVDTLTEPDAVPGPMLDARITSGSAAGHPDAYVRVDLCGDSATLSAGLDLADVGLQFYLRDVPALAGVAWTFRGDNLCAWEDGLRRKPRRHEIVIDPDIGRVLFGVATAAERDALVQSLPGGRLRARIGVGYTYGAAGPVGAHPVSRPVSSEFGGRPAEVRRVGAGATLTLQDALGGLDTGTSPVIVEITDSRVHRLDPAAVAGAAPDGGATLASLRLARPLVIRAAGGERPVVELAAPLAFRPTDPGAATTGSLVVRLEGLFLARGETLAATDPLVVRAAVSRLEIDGCTLDPGGHRRRDGLSRAPMMPSLSLRNGYGFTDGDEEDAFEPTPDVVVQRSITGALLIDDGYRVVLQSSIVDAGRDVGDDPGDAFALGPASDPVDGWAAPLEFQGVTFLGRVRVAEAIGSGALFVHPVQVRNHQHGCIKHSCFPATGNRLPPCHACVNSQEAKLAFVSTWFGDPGYGQLALGCDFRIRNRGPGDDAMGAFGFQLEAHKWSNLGIRLREFMPVGVRPLTVAVT